MKRAHLARVTKKWTHGLIPPALDPIGRPTGKTKNGVHAEEVDPAYGDREKETTPPDTECRIPDPQMH